MADFKAIAFDLDDTLLDTSGLLIPLASQRACEAMIEAGVRCTLEECMRDRKEMSASHSHTEIFTHIVNRYGTNQKGRAVHDALEKFYNPELPAVLPLLPEALENLLYLKKKYKLYLVTVGAPDAQVAKIRSLNIQHLFEKVYVLNGFIGEKKDIAFNDIIARESIKATELLCVGNRLSSEIREGKRCGAMTCYFAHGEHIGETPQCPEDHPDFTVTLHKELIAACDL
jgi:putative hydrolase of the HAD superfamily